ncbi:MAG: NRDE family protein [Deltaproteobacteria bacterium]|nr:NRDE family protein [Deltaproteobacteria bacterium]
MCLILLSFKQHSRYPVILAANRDEFYERPSAPVTFWDEAPNILAGRDMKDGGTWLGITRKGRIAAVTNYRNPASIKDDAPSAKSRAGEGGPRLAACRHRKT